MEQFTTQQVAGKANPSLPSGWSVARSLHASSFNLFNYTITILQIREDAERGKAVSGKVAEPRFQPWPGRPQPGLILSHHHLFVPEKKAIWSPDWRQRFGLPWAHNVNLVQKLICLHSLQTSLHYRELNANGIISYSFLGASFTPRDCSEMNLCCCVFQQFILLLSSSLW